MKKRLLSLAIAICMVAAMLPTVAAADSVSAPSLEVGEAISYYFYAYASTKNGDIAGKTVADATEYNAEYERYWKYNSGRTTNIPKSQLKMNRLEVQSTAANYWLALTINVPDDGTYSVNYKYYAFNGRGCVGDVYILPYGTALGNLTNALKKATKIASVDYSTSGTSTVTDAESIVETIDLEAGDHMLLFVPTAAGLNATSYTYYTYPTSLTLTLTEKAPTEDEELTNAFTPDDSDVTAYAPSVDAVTTVTGTSATEQADGSYKMVAPETDGSGNEFLYWAKGLSLNKRIVSLEREFTYTPAGGDRNYLIPVYAPESATGNEYYNANGQLIDCAAEAPDLPAMAGYGAASKWVQYEDTNIYVAEYDNKTQPDDVEVTVNGTEYTVPYGTDITCTAEDKDADNKPFKCWIKSGINGKEEIVSCDKSYTFKAWEDCTVTAVYEEHTPISTATKIIIDNFTVAPSVIGIMAEFIGLDSAVEKGIMFGTQKIAMTKPGTQFTVTADENGTYKGYAIVEDGEGGYTLITDGSVTISDEE